MLPAQRFGVSTPASVLKAVNPPLGKATLNTVSLADQEQEGPRDTGLMLSPVHTLHMAVEEERLRIRRNTYRMVSTFTETMAH